MRSSASIRTVAVVAAVALAAAACGGGQGGAGQPSRAKGDLKGVELNVLMNPALLKAIGGEEDAGLVREFENTTGVKVVVVTAPVGEHVQRAMGDFSAKTGTFDVINMQNSDLHEQVTPFLLDLAPRIKAAGSDWNYEDFPKPIREPVSGSDGQVVGVPFRFGANMLYYRKDLFAKHGIAVPKTFDQLRAAAKTLATAEPGVTPIYQRGKAEEIVHDWLGYLNGAGGQLLSKDNKSCALNSPQGVAAARLFADLYAAGHLPKDLSAVGRDEYIGAMQQGRAGMGVYYSPYWLSLVGKDSKVADKMGWALQPTMPGVKAGRSRAGGWYLTANKDSKNADAAWAFIEFVTNPKNALRSALEWGQGPVRESTYTNAEYQKKFPLAKDWLVALDASAIDPTIPQITQVIDTLSPVLVSIFTGAKDPQAALNDACRKIDSLL